MFIPEDADKFFPRYEERHQNSVADHYRHTYFEALDLVIHCVHDRFDQPGLKVLRNIEDLIDKAASYSYEHCSEEFLFVAEFYSDDVNKDTLKVQLETLKTNFSKQHNDQIRLSHVLDYIRKLPPSLQVSLLRCCGGYTNLTDNASYKCNKRGDVFCASEN
ncbi:hypothetical protein DPMN_160177 [Dreissena polymorpha]|uniref:Uncharacterized protein n=1 Tax=Dreissena polymorpha TaxID=45954 RepID=A0A9D4EMR1_DREPO|nr:hypothetical protein DPMN_160177 [Dreissena polymorpha]